jgi:hypothetical protein
MRNDQTAGKNHAEKKKERKTVDEQNASATPKPLSKTSPAFAIIKVRGRVLCIFSGFLLCLLSFSFGFAFRLLRLRPTDKRRTPELVVMRASALCSVYLEKCALSRSLHHLS